MAKQVLSHLALLSANLMFGANYTIAKKLMPQHIKPFGFIFIRVVFVIALFWLLHLVVKTEKIEKRDFIRLFFCGMFGVAINQLFFFKGLSITTPINASLIMVTTPILVFLIAVAARKEVLTWYKTVGIAIGATGALYLLIGKQFQFSSETALGDLFVLINALSYGVYLTLVKPLMEKYKPITIIKWMFLFGFIPVSIVGFREFSEVEWHLFPTSAWLALAFVILGVTCGAYLLNMYAISKVNTSVVGIYIYLQPLIAALIALVLREDILSLEKIVSAILIFFGVYLVSFYKPKLKMTV